MNHRTNSTSSVSVLRRGAARVGHQAAAIVRQVWQRHSRLLATNPGYAATVAALAAALVSQANASDIIPTAVAGGLAIYASLRRTLAHC